MTIQSSEQVLPQPHDVLKIDHPEEREVFTNQKVLIIGGPDAHGASMAVTSAQYLEKRGAETQIYIGSPVIREGKGATHPGAFYSKTLPSLNIEGFDRVVVTDIPLDFKHLEQSEEGLIQLAQRLAEDRQRRKLPPIDHPVLFLDHHNTTKFQKDAPSIVVKWVPQAEACRLGSEPSRAARIGAICDRDVVTLPVTDEEMILAKGLDAAVRPDPDDPRPALPKNATEANQVTFQETLTAWEERTQTRLNQTVERLKADDWDYFRQEGERLSRVEVPTASGFGQIALVDTQDLTGKFAVLKLMEMAIENAGVDKTPYAIGILRSVEDKKMGREPADIVTVIRHWTREDLPSVEDIITKHLDREFIEKYRMYGVVNAKTVRLPVNDRETARIAAELVQAFAGREMPDFSQVRSVVMCGDPNSGKSVYSTILREALKELGVKVAHLDLDKAAPTPSWYLDAEIAHKDAEILFSQGRLSQKKLNEARNMLAQAAERRKAMKRPWSIKLAEEAKQELIGAAQSDEHDFVIGDIGGGKIKRDETGKIIKITRLTAENARILEGADAVIIVSNNPDGAAEWKKLIEIGVDPETGVRINRVKPLEIIGIYQSILEGSVQQVAGTREEAGVVTNLDRSKAERKYNPSIFASAMFISEAVESRTRLEHYLKSAMTNLEVTSRTAKGVLDTTSSEGKEDYIVQGLKPEEVALAATENFADTITYLYYNRHKSFSDPRELQDFVEDITRRINLGITQNDTLIRTFDSEKYSYTKTSDLSETMKQFYDELYMNLQNPSQDPEELAAWIEYRIDLTDHFFADGCGKTAKAISSWILMRYNHPLPAYHSREELYDHAPSQRRDLDSQKDRDQFDRWLVYYKSLFWH